MNVRAKCEAWESHFMLPGVWKSARAMNPHTPKWALTLGIKVSMDSQIFRERFQGSKLINQRISYTIKKFLECRCLKWVHMTHLDTSNTSYGQKKGRESNWQFDFWPLKIRNHPNLLTFRWRARYRWKVFDEGYNFASNFISIGGLHTKLWAPKVVGIPTFGISGFPLWSLGTKWHLNAGPMAKHIVYYKGEGGGFPKSGLWWFLWVCVCPWLVHALKCSNYTLTNLFFHLCSSIWVIDLLINLPNPHLGISTRPFTPEALQAKEHGPIPSPSIVFTFGLIIESIKELDGASLCIYKCKSQNILNLKCRC